MAFCKKCGAENPPGSVFCNRCKNRMMMEVQKGAAAPRPASSPTQQQAQLSPEEIARRREILRRRQLLAAQKKRARDRKIKITAAICAVAVVAVTFIAILNPLASSKGPDTLELEAVSLLLPEENAVIQSDEAMLYWAPVLGADNYTLVVVGESSSYFNISTAETHCAVSHLLDDVVYWWKVAAVKDGQYGPFSSFWPFTVNTKLDVPSSPSPNSGSVHIDEAPTLQWAYVSGASEYRVQIAEDTDFSKLIIDVLTPSTSYQPNVKMSNDTTYHWRVKAHQSSIWSDWSDVSSFFISPTVLHYSHTWTYPTFDSEEAGEYTISVDIQAEDYYAYKAVPRMSGYSLQDYSSYVTSNDPVVEEIAAQLKKIATSKGYNQFATASFVLSFVQDLPYELDSDSVGLKDYPRYPVETLIDGTGDCEDVAALFASLIRSSSFNMDAVLVYLTNNIQAHMAVGLSIDLPATPSSTTWTYAGKVYYYCEATNPIPIGFPTDASSWSYVIIPL